MKGFGFPIEHHEHEYRPDTSKQKSELTYDLTKSERLWNEGKQQQSLVYLRKSINLIQYIAKNEGINEIKHAYQTKLNQLKNRYQTRNKQQNHREEKLIPNTGGGKKSNNNQNNGLKGQVSQAIVTQKPNVKWQDVVGLQNAKSALKQAVILPIKFPEIFTGSRKPWKGILLYGPPGTGKTYLAKACATQAQGTFFSVSSSDLMSKWVGQSQRLIKSLFAVARERKPSIIFIDEIDSMCGNRSEGQNEASRRVKTQFLVQMEGLGHDDTGVLVLGATNLPWTLDPAVRRRFQRRIYISLPQLQARYGMLKKNMKDNKNNLSEDDFKKLAKMTQNFSGSDIAILVRDAVYEPVRRFQAATHFKEIDGKFTPCKKGEEGVEGNWANFPKNKIDIGIITNEDFEESLKRTKPSVDNKQLKQYEDWTQTFGQDG